jgi:Tol biopolymer transport system component
LSQGNKLFSGNIITKNLADKDKESLLVSNAFLPQWSPDGKTLAFMRQSGDKFQIETINTGGGGQNPVTKESVSAISNTVLPYNSIQTSDYSWSPDGQKIAYISDRNDQSNIWIINSDGSNDTKLTNEADLEYKCPLWSADGKRIAFTAQTNNAAGKPTFNVAVVDTETKKTDPIWSGTPFTKLVGWSASGKELILASVESAAMTGQPREVSLLLLTIETKQMSEIVKLEETYLYNIHLSPDKKTVAFVAHRNGLDNIWTMPAAGGTAKQVSGNNDSRFYFSSLAWSPDGSMIFYGKQSRFSLLSMLTNFK